MHSEWIVLFLSSINICNNKLDLFQQATLKKKRYIYLMLCSVFFFECTMLCKYTKVIWSWLVKPSNLFLARVWAIDCWMRQIRLDAVSCFMECSLRNICFSSGGVDYTPYHTPVVYASIHMFTCQWTLTTSN